MLKYLMAQDNIGSSSPLSWVELLLFFPKLRETPPGETLNIDKGLSHDCWIHQILIRTPSSVPVALGCWCITEHELLCVHFVAMSPVCFLCLFILICSNRNKDFPKYFIHFQVCFLTHSSTPYSSQSTILLVVNRPYWCCLMLPLEHGT